MAILNNLNLYKLNDNVKWDVGYKNISYIGSYLWNIERQDNA